MYTSFKMKLSLMIVASSLALGVSTSSIFILWIFLELNMLGILPLLSMASSKTNNSLKYFISQALGSIIIFLSVVMFSFSLNLHLACFWGSMGSLWKLGAFPFHLWFFNVGMDCSWPSFLLLSSIQKVLPMLMLENFVNYLIIYSAVFGASLVVWGCFNQTNLKKIFIYSSIFSLSWMLLSLLFFSNSWVLLLLIYFLILSSLTFFFWEQTLGQGFGLSLIELDYSKKMSLVFTLLILSGIPPFAGFMMKMLVLKIMLKMLVWAFSLFMVVSSVFVMYMYLAFSLNIFMSSELAYNWGEEAPMFNNCLLSLMFTVALDLMIIF